jgi:mono/diheme cytochrome c family protein
VALTDGYIYTLIRVGRGIMPAYAHQIAHYDRWHVVNYVRQLQGPQAAPTPDTPPVAPAQEE